MPEPNSDSAAQDIDDDACSVETVPDGRDRKQRRHAAGLTGSPRKSSGCSLAILALQRLVAGQPEHVFRRRRGRDGERLRPWRLLRTGGKDPALPALRYRARQ